jgi:hypothetical protein
MTITNNGTIIGMGGAGGHGTEWSVVEQPGTRGGDAVSSHINLFIINNGIFAGGGGGGAGNAITLNGSSVSWISGNNPNQVKGPIQ